MIVDHSVITGWRRRTTSTRQHAVISNPPAGHIGRSEDRTLSSDITSVTAHAPTARTRSPRASVHQVRLTAPTVVQEIAPGRPAAPRWTAHGRPLDRDPGP